MINIKKIDHIAVCVSGLDESIAQFTKLLGVEASDRDTVEAQKTEACMFHCGDTAIELITPAGGNVGLEKFLEKRGQALHHIAFEVDDIEGTLARLEAAGIPLLDKKPRPGLRGHRVAFLHPKAFGGVLVELVEPSH
jgi:methylmalonyl-CoA/ethylmalonyl-CoA epimerase